MCAGMTRHPERGSMPLWLEYALMLACAAIAVYCCFAPDAAFATPFLWVDTVNGDDASANPYQPNTPLRTYARAIELMRLNGEDTVGVKIKPGSAPPSAEEAYIIMARKPDKVRTQQKKEVVAGHGELPDVEREESAEAGIAIVQQYVWKLRYNVNGPQEYLETVNVTVEDY